jgi:membrane protein implicated in regulation of membrane protease activity
MHQIRRASEVIFVLTLAALLLGGVLFVAGQAIALVAGQGDFLRFFNESVKPPLCVAASVCAVAGFLLSYKSRQSRNQKQTRQEAETR